ncbi:hypothetical protein [Janthinobacterium fluminis]|uniref:Uncharacterized protein n=1 Tax=Janthinobacterium fluminis TaxID=2987524 RepID=A0ABT5K4J3_9BURK|nr:hypothetical protein [Janthinobacterium fluminis]MDC8759922.1 hypothetical protein [Janthinobacterium fluminis]
MESRLFVLEEELTAIRTDVAVIKSNYATKTDLAELKHELMQELDQLRLATKIDMAELKHELLQKLDQLRLATKTDMAELKHELMRELDQLRLTMKTDMAELRQEMHQELLKTNTALAELRQRFDDILPSLVTKAEMHSEFSKMRTWVVGVAIALFLSSTSTQIAMYNLLKAPSAVAPHTAAAYPASRPTVPVLR